jgi:hypothetical protein
VLSGLWLLDIFENPVLIKRIESCLRPARIDVSRGDYYVTCTAIKKREMLLAHSIRTSVIQSFDLFAICRLQQAKHSYIAGLKLVRGVGRKPTEDDVIFKTKLHDFE